MNNLIDTIEDREKKIEMTLTQTILKIRRKKTMKNNKNKNNITIGSKINILGLL